MKHLNHFLTKLNNFLLNEREMFKALFDTESFYVPRSKVSPFYGSMIYLSDIAHHTFTLEEFVEISMVVKGLIAAQVRQLCLFTNSEM